MQVPLQEKDLFKRSLLSYLPGIKVKEIADYLNDALSDTSHMSIAELKLSGHAALSLHNQKALSEHDPIAYLTGNMTKLKKNELIAFQIVCSPVSESMHGKLIGEMNSLRRKIYKGEPLTSTLNQHFFKKLVSLPVISILWFGITVIFKICMGLLKFLLDIIAYSTSDTKSNMAALAMAQRQPILLQQEIFNPYEQELQTIVKEKIGQHLFESSIRILAAGDEGGDITMRMSGLLATFGQLTSTYQSLQTKSSLLPGSRKINLRLKQFQKRILSPNSIFNQNPILSTSEISDLYHFPYMNTTKTEDMVKILSRELPAPLSLKSADNLDVVFAKNTYGGEETLIGLSNEDRRRHTAIFGQTGSGKSTIILSMIHEDIKNDKGLCVIDPHGQLAEATLASIVDAGREKDLVLFEPDDLEHLVAINLMELTPNLDKYQTLREKEFICESIVSLFRKVFADSFGSNPHRIESILRNTIHTAFTVEGATLFTIYDLLTDPTFRTKVVSQITDERLQKFWKNLFGKAGSWQQVKMIAPVTSRIERFLFSPSAREILDHKKSTINFDEIMDSGKIFVCDLSKGKLGEDTSQVLGMLVLTKIQLAALKRARMAEEKRRDFYLYVDEFQNFATLSFVQMLSEARKYRLNLILAEQSTAQQKDKQITNILFANTGTIVTFKTASPEDEAIILPQFEPYVKAGEVHNLPAYHFFIKLGAMTPEEPFSGVTVPIKIKQNQKAVAAMIVLSHKKYAILSNEKVEGVSINLVKQPSSMKQKQKKILPKRKPKIGRPEEESFSKNVLSE